jgi:hypothetical protein
MDTVGAVAMVGHHRFGYALFDRILFEPGRSSLSGTTFSGLGDHFAWRPSREVDQLAGGGTSGGDGVPGAE